MGVHTRFLGHALQGFHKTWQSGAGLDDRECFVVATLTWHAQGQHIKARSAGDRKGCMLRHAQNLGALRALPPADMAWPSESSALPLSCIPEQLDNAQQGSTMQAA